MRVYLISPPRSPLARLLSAIVAALVLVGAFMLGLAALAVVVGLALIVGVAAWVRAWWIGRRQGTADDGRHRATQRSDVLDAEYTVITTSRRQNKGRRSDTEL